MPLDLSGAGFKKFDKAGREDKGYGRQVNVVVFDVVSKEATVYMSC